MIARQKNTQHTKLTSSISARACHFCFLLLVKIATSSRHDLSKGAISAVYGSHSRQLVLSGLKNLVHLSLLSEHFFT
ncbi:hypothetical protein F2Q69_00002610 [Brassica cretica]|uniref:Uncharacterized protein n=1 Tax=Brassica cretica TaxID=69181 RepID=A0A8S9P3K9_BRACR|nr:hypothetical protein F2Q69_00002610 [Brassica cretica]